MNFFLTLMAGGCALWLRWLVMPGLVGFLGVPAAWGQNSGRLWEEVVLPAQAEGVAAGSHGRVFELDRTVLRTTLGNAGAGGVMAAGRGGRTEPGAVIELPMPDGTRASFWFEETAVMDPALGAKYPEIRTFRGRGIEDPAALLCFDETPAGFHAQVLSPHGAVYIDPVTRGDNRRHVAYYKRDYARPADGFACASVPVPAGGPVVAAGFSPMGDQVRTYRLACAATAEYTAYHGGTVAAGLAAIVTAINRVNGVYEAELGIRLVLVANNDLIVYTDGATDPYSNWDDLAMLGQNQATLDAVIGTGNYDVGHVFSTGGGGRAYVGSVCNSGFKAGGVTGLVRPTGDVFWIDYVAHEMGHQFGANHTYNSSVAGCVSSRCSTAAYEPGSGSTIMGYAGLCGADNLATTSDPFFHFVSIGEIAAFVAQAGSCASLTPATNGAPQVFAGPSYTIPKATPFTLTATGSDPDGDPLLYSWEQRDLGPAATLASADSGVGPLFRSYRPTTNASRTFPRLTELLVNAATPAEKLPVLPRTMNFRVTARDYHAGCGGVAMDDMQVVVASNAGPFVVTSPNAAVVWSNAQTVRWDVAGTTNLPVNAAAVDILLSTNGGWEFPIVLAAGTANDGAETVILPPLSTSAARIKVQAVSNIFFDISNTNFTLVPYTAAPVLALGQTVLEGENFVPANGRLDPGESAEMRFELVNVGSASTTNLVATLLPGNGVALPGLSQAYGSLAPQGTGAARTFAFTATNPCGTEVAAVLQLTDGGVSLGTVTQRFVVGTSVITTTRFTNSGSITLRDNQVASPYPVNISASGLAGSVIKASVTLHGLSHNRPDDLDLLVAGPGGKKTLLLSDAGGATKVNGLHLTFEDGAGAAVPDTGPLVSGVYRASNYETNSDNFPAPAPTGPYGSELAALAGASPNGTWSLFAVDDASGDSGTISGGWSLALTTSNLVCATGPMQADLGLVVTASPTPVKAGESVYFTLVVTNAGPATALGVVVANSLHPAFSLVTAIGETFAFDTAEQSHHLCVGTLLPGASTTLFIQAQAGATGSFTNLFTLMASTVDSLPANNTVQLPLTVLAGGGVQVLSSIPDLMLVEGQTLLLSTTAGADLPATPLYFTLGSKAPPGIQINPLNGLVTWTTTEADGPSTNHITVFVTDNGDPPFTADQSFTILVLETNSSPELAPIPEVMVHAGSTVTILPVATDPDIPANPLEFSLAGLLPGNVALDAATGALTWPTSDADVLTTNQFLLVASDPGLLSATTSVSVIVLPRPRITSIAASNSIVRLTWETIPGQTYRLQYQSQAGDTNWVELPDAFPANANSTEAIDPLPASIPNRFYRVRAGSE